MDSINCERSVQNIQCPNRLNGVKESGAKNARDSHRRSGNEKVL